MTRPNKGPRGQTKPCACGRPGCMIVQGENDRPSRFRDQKVASKACAGRISKIILAARAEIEPPPAPADPLLHRLMALRLPSPAECAAHLGVPVIVRRGLAA